MENILWCIGTNLLLNFVFEVGENGIIDSFWNYKNGKQFYDVFVKKSFSPFARSLLEGRRAC
jgi:hypothetical protein